MIKIRLIIISTVLLSISCNNKNEIKKDLKILHSKSITMPDDIKFLVYGKDSIITDFMASELKLVVYHDSLVCNTCNVIKIADWNDLLGYAKGFNNRLKFYFIFSPKKNNDYPVRFALKNALFDYPVILDSEGEFRKLNPHLPKNTQLHTFLLDENNKVILVGNPLNNPKIEEMFYKIVEEKLGEK